MTLHRCSQCTLMRCAAPGLTCDECQSHAVDKAVNNGAPLVFTYSISAPGAPGAPVVTYSTAQALKDLKSLPIPLAAAVIREWIHDSFTWAQTQKGSAFWLALWKELERIQHGGTP